MRYYIVNKDGYCLINGRSRYELREGDIIITESNVIYGEMVKEVAGSFNMKWYPFQLRVDSKITKFNQYTGVVGCSNQDPHFNPYEPCYCAIHSGILSEITIQMLRQSKLEELGV